MPTRKVKGGYKWGKHGHVYPTKAGADRQAAAIFANGYRGDRLFGPDGPLARGQAAQRLRVPMVVENRYVLALRRIVGQAHDHILNAAHLRMDSAKQHGAITVANVRVKAAIRKPIARAFDQMSDGVKKANRLALQAIPLADLAIESNVITKFRENNIQLISAALDDFSDDIRKVLDDQEDEGLRVEVLAKRLRERSDVSKSRAELIARDQTLKINSQVNQTRQRAAGLTQYKWSTSHDDRVRDSHKALDGEICDWANPPDVDGEPLNPGEDFQCRCIAIPVFDSEVVEQPDEIESTDQE